MAITLRNRSAAVAATFAVVTRIRKQWKGRNYRGRTKGTRNIERGESTWVSDYLGESHIYGLRSFRRRFRVPRGMFAELHHDLTTHFPQIWSQRKNAVGRLGIRSEVRVLACLRFLGTSRSFDDMDDAARMAPETLRGYVKEFCTAIHNLYGDLFLNRLPTSTELCQVQDNYGDYGFRGCVCAVDCCKIVWKNCPFSLKGQYHNTKEWKLVTIQVEAWCERNQYIWHWFTGTYGTNNDKTMLSVSPLFNSMLNGT